MSRDHRKLRAFQLADEFVMMVYDRTQKFPRDEWFGLRSQVRRAAVSTTANIVEGSARISEAEYRNHLNIAFASLREAGYYIGLSHRLEYIGSPAFQELTQLHAETARVLAALIRSLQRLK